MFGSKGIELTASVLLALEGMRQALEVLLGARITLVESLWIELGKYDGAGTRKISFTAQVVILDPTAELLLPRRLNVVEVKLYHEQPRAEWSLGRATFHLTEPSKPTPTEYCAHWRQLDRYRSEVKIAEVHPRDVGSAQWCIGTDAANRRYEPVR